MTETPNVNINEDGDDSVVSPQAVKRPTKPVSDPLPWLIRNLSEKQSMTPPSNSRDLSGKNSVRSTP
ncbi:hypothetical protein [Rubripirellula tenax]|nr:hypothetical protein [Rubripirellula tenax]